MNKNSFVRLILSLCFLANCGCTSAILQSSQKPHNINTNVLDPNELGYFLPKGLIRLAMNQDTKGVLVLTIETQYIPDPDHFYTFKYNPNPGCDDEISITLDANGMLSDINVTATDKSAAIVGKILEIAKEAAKIPLAYPAKVRGPEALPLIDTIFDPNIFLENRTDEIKKLKTQWQDYLSDITLEPKTQGVTKEEEPSPQNGIYYRPLLPYELTLTGDKNYKFVKTVTILLPNKSPILSLDIRRAPFVQKVTHLTFASGVLTEVHITKPSEILGAMDIPLNIVKTITSLPTDLIQFKIDYSSKQEALLKQLQSQLEAERALKQSQTPQSPTPQN